MAQSGTSARAGNSGIQVGQPAPDFTLLNQAGVPLRFSSLLGKGPIVLYFYPKDESVGCTAEACAFRDSYTVFKDAGAEVVGISTDSVQAHRQFAQNHRLPFILLSDTNGEARDLYNAKAMFGLLTGRITFVIDKNGIIQHSFKSLFNASKHVDEALAVVKRLQAHE